MLRPLFARAAPLLVLPMLIFGAAPAAAELQTGNLIRNPGAEAGPGHAETTCGAEVVVVPDWIRGGNFTAVQYAAGDLGAAKGRQIGGGANYFEGGCSALSTGDQTVNVSAVAADIDGGQATAALSGYLGGFETQADQAKVEVFFQGGGGTDLGSPGADLAIGPVTAQDRANRTNILFRRAQRAVPAGTRTIRTLMTMTRFAGTLNDGYVDKLSLSLATPPDPPSLGRDVNVDALSGPVLVDLPGRGGFVPLDQARQVPVGSKLDTRRGAVRLTSARNRQGNTQTGQFGGVIFRVLQARASGGLTDVNMLGGRFSSCAGSRRAASRSGLAKRVIRKLDARARRGRFRTRGRYSASTVRGTVWTVADRCDGTLTTVRKGTVVVRDFSLDRNVIVRAGRRYLARAPGT